MKRTRFTKLCSALMVVLSLSLSYPRCARADETSTGLGVSIFCFMNGLVLMPFGGWYAASGATQANKWKLGLGIATGIIGVAGTVVGIFGIIHYHGLPDRTGGNTIVQSPLITPGVFQLQRGLSLSPSVNILPGGASVGASFTF